MQKLKLEITFTRELTAYSLASWAEYLQRMLKNIEPIVKDVTYEITDVQANV